MPTLYVLATPLGNLRDLSPRAVETLRQVSLIAAEDTRHTAGLLQHFKIDTPMVSYHKYNEAERSAQLVERMVQQGQDVALVSDAGTPGINDPGYDLVAAAIQAGVEVRVVPGPSAVAAALSVCGFAMDRFTFCGFAPRDKKALVKLLENLQRADAGIAVLYESPHRIAQTLEGIAQTLPQAEVCLCNDMTKLHERYDRGTAEQVLQAVENNPRAGLGEYVLVLRLPQPAPQENTAALAGLSAPAAVLDCMIKYDLPARQAAERLLQQKAYPRNQLYKAALALKTIEQDLK